MRGIVAAALAAGVLFPAFAQQPALWRASLLGPEDPACLWSRSRSRRAFGLKGAPEGHARLQFSQRCILAAVARRMDVALREDVVPPEVRFEKDVTLKEFQDAVEPQWGVRPDVILNVYIPRLNRIYLIDDAGYYRRLRRQIDDSLAHEYTHFVQVRYQGADLHDDSLEGGAVEVQTWFRETYFASQRPVGDPCAP